MPNVAQVLKDEIIRLARREIRTQVDKTKKAAAQHKRRLAELERQVGALARQVSAMQRQLRAASASVAPGRAASASAAVEPAARKVRFSAKGLRAHRERVGLSAADYAKLLGVSTQTVYNWERGSSAPGEAQRAKLAELRGAGKRALRARLAQAG
jgi:DNA-binding transcriptional regulator YiaG